MKAAAPPASLDGVLNVCKPVGMTSHDVVDAVRRLARTRRVGHAGTLDPGASGVLVLALEHATRIAEFLANAGKEYRVEITCAWGGTRWPRRPPWKNFRPWPSRTGFAKRCSRWMTR